MPRKGTIRRYIRVVLGLSLGVILLACAFITRSLPAADMVTLFETWLGGLGLWGPLVFGLLYIAGTLMFLPVVVLMITAGVLFGWRNGTLIASLASVISAALPFLIARYLTRETATRRLQEQPRLAAVAQAFAHGSWKIIVLFRLSPVLPFSLQNYLFGLTPIGFWPYLIATWLAMLPGTLFFAYIGHVTKTAATDPHRYMAAEWAAVGIGLVATVAVSLYLTALTKKNLREQMLMRARNGTVIAPEQYGKEKVFLHLCRGKSLSESQEEGK